MFSQSVILYAYIGWAKLNGANLQFCLWQANAFIKLKILAGISITYTQQRVTRCQFYLNESVYATGRHVHHRLWYRLTDIYIYIFIMKSYTRGVALDTPNRIKGVSRNALYKCTILTYLLTRYTIKRKWKKDKREQKHISICWTWTDWAGHGD